MKIGLYFGSFNPIHHGHLIIANYVLQYADVDQVWFIVSPQNPLKSSNSLLNEYHRLYLVQCAIEGEKNLRAKDTEFKLPKPSYTVDTLTYLQEQYPSYQFSVIMGSDSFSNLSRWKNYAFIVKHYPIYVYRRTGHEIHPDATLTARPIIMDAPLIEISATHIRENIKSGKSIRYLVPEKVREEIEQNGYYK
ncbi:MAG TPA: nicotinate (nicotinamide) nucleotide adenylyltransferase [Puia sp.]|jgi:nicotinate-nucleotide adenylyltransferase|nr:nicotinate (nicotinamide) nucleotide adenylyltransferase [Puia sp.]